MERGGVAAAQDVTGGGSEAHSPTPQTRHWTRVRRAGCSTAVENGDAAARTRFFFETRRLLKMRCVKIELSRICASVDVACTQQSRKC